MVAFHWLCVVRNGEICKVLFLMVAVLSKQQANEAVCCELSDVLEGKGKGWCSKERGWWFQEVFWRDECVCVCVCMYIHTYIHIYRERDIYILCVCVYMCVCVTVRDNQGSICGYAQTCLATISVILLDSNKYVSASARVWDFSR